MAMKLKGCEVNLQTSAAAILEGLPVRSWAVRWKIRSCCIDTVGDLLERTSEAFWLDVFDVGPVTVDAMQRRLRLYGYRLKARHYQ